MARPSYTIVKQLLNALVWFGSHGRPVELSGEVSLPRTPKEWCFARWWFQQASDEGFLEGVWSAEWYVCWGLQRPNTRHCCLAATRSPRMTPGSNRKTAKDSLSKDRNYQYHQIPSGSWGFTHGNLAEICLISILQWLSDSFHLEWLSYAQLVYLHDAPSSLIDKLQSRYILVCVKPTGQLSRFYISHM